MESSKVRMGIRDRLMQQVEAVSLEEMQHLRFLAPEVIYDPDKEKGGEAGEDWNRSGGSFDWFTIGMGNNIRKRRKTLRITQAELARRMHMSSTTISRIESGKVNLCGQEINGLCKELKCLVTDIWPDASVTQKRTSDRKIMIEAMRRLLEDLDREAEESE